MTSESRPLNINSMNQLENGDNIDSSLTSSISSSPVISNSSSAASSSSTLPVENLNQENEDVNIQEKILPVEGYNSESIPRNIYKKIVNNSDEPFSKTSGKQQDYSSVRVAVRIRPQSYREQVEMCKICTNVTPREPQITLGYKDDKSFTYDYVYDIGSKQQTIFDESVKFLVEGCLDGYNATVLAYGQTGSGKTYTMGTSFDETAVKMEETGILPRSISYLFSQIEKIKQAQNESTSPVNREVIVNAQFIELYNEEVIDLLDTGPNASQLNEPVQDLMSSNYASLPVTPAPTFRSKIEIHEDQYGGIFINGCSNKNVNSVAETLEILKNGAKIRSTGSTNMNSQSSRSHAIFTLNVKQKCALTGEKSSDSQEDCQTLNAKFHFVDLAGSERLKRTGATGSRAKEGICINRGLLALGNVISALGDREKIGCHVPYRDSKLTRLLQDSLGGNSRTLMIACVSPSDRDFMETLNTLRYANRARNIKNKISVNQDKTSQKIAQLMEEIERLKYELAQYKSKSGNAKMTTSYCDASVLHSASRTTSSCTIVALQNTPAIDDSVEYKNLPDEYICMINKLKQENCLLLADNQNLRIKSKALHETLEQMKIRNCELEYNNQQVNGVKNFSQNSSSCETNHKSFIMQIEELRCKLVESELTCKYLKQSQYNNKANIYSTESLNNNSAPNETETPNEIFFSNNQLIINDAKKDIELNIDQLNKLKLMNEEYNNDLKSIESITHESSSSSSYQNSNDITTQEDESSRDSESSLINNTSSSNSNQTTNNISSKANDENQERLAIEIENLGVEIDMKKRLINELESNNKNLEKMKNFYENKLNTLTSRIRQIEEEREKLIANMTENDSTKYEEQVRKIRAEYELKLQSLQSEVLKYQRIKSKNSEMLKTAANNEKELTQLNKEVLDMKRLKVKLMNQLKDETIRFKKEEQNRMREIAALKRDHLKKDNQIKFLEAEKRCKEIVLKRKQEQLQALRRNTTRLSDKASGKTTNNSSLNNQNSSTSTNNSNTPNSLNKTTFNTSLKNSNGPEMTTIFKKKSLFSKSFQIKWQKLDQIIHGLILKKQAISLIEREMERFLEQREKISRKINRLVDRLNRKIEAAQYIMEPIEPRNNGQPTELNIADAKIEELKDRIDVMKSNVDYLQDQIAECQTNIIQLDELKDGNDYVNLENFIETITTINESKYFIKKLLVLALNKGIVAAKKEYLSNELKCELEQFERDYNTQQDLLKNIINSSDCKGTSLNNQSNVSNTTQHLNNCFDNYFKNQNQTNGQDLNPYDNFEIDEIILAPQLEDSSTESEDDDDTSMYNLKHRQLKTQISAVTNQISDETSISLADSFSMNTQSSIENSLKVRQLVTKGPQDLLYCSYNNLDEKTDSGYETTKNDGKKNLVEISTNTIYNADQNNQAKRICSLSYTKIPELVQNSENSNTETVVVNNSNSKNGYGYDGNNNQISNPQHVKMKTSNSNLNNIPMSKSVIVTSSDSSNYKRMTRSTISRQTSKDSFVSTSPSRSPVNHSKRFTIRNENVFNRLTSETKQSPMPERGIIKTYSGNTNRFRSSPITLSHVAEGHSKAVLTVDSYDYKLFTGSKDRTAKVWDLITGQELAALVGHSNNVTKVRYDKNTQLYFTVSNSYVKVWDLRESSTKCIKNLCSSGMVYDGNTALNMMKSTNKMSLNENAMSENMINDLCVDENGNYMYLAAGNTVKIWDLKQFTEIAKLSGGQNSSIMTMLIHNNQIITGSKDHIIRVFDLTPNFNLFNTHSNSSTYLNSDSSSPSNQSESSLFNGGVTVSKYNMMPPHYDGVQTLCRIEDSLFSGSRDMCIKKWSMNDHQCKQSINNAHKDWICSLDYLSDYNNNILLSGCRGGYLKMWNVDTFEKIADFRAHLCPINSIKVNSNMLFTASDDATVRIWRKDSK